MSIAATGNRPVTPTSSATSVPEVFRAAAPLPVGYFADPDVSSISFHELPSNRAMRSVW